MEWEDEGIILSKTPYGESSHIISIFTKSHGLRTGLHKVSQKLRNHIQPGIQVKARWWARLSTQLGQWNLDPLHSLPLVSSSLLLECLNSSLALLVTTLPPHQPHGNLYEGFCFFLETFKKKPSPLELIISYIHFELLFLKTSGFGLDLSQCAVTQQTEDLIYVSPKSGRAVSRLVGDPYKEKLLKLPPFLLSDPSANADLLAFSELQEGLSLTGYFIKTHIFDSLSLPLPQSRYRLLEILKKISKDF